MTENMVGMFTQKASKMYRYAFGVHTVTGDEPKLYVRGVWMWYGQDEAPLELKQHPSYEFYNKRKLDITKPEDKKLV